MRPIAAFQHSSFTIPDDEIPSGVRIALFPGGTVDRGSPELYNG